MYLLVLLRKEQIDDTNAVPQPQAGGCVWASSSLVVHNSSFEGCRCTLAGGAIAQYPQPAPAAAVGAGDSSSSSSDAAAAAAAPPAAPPSASAAITSTNFTNCSAVGASPKGGAVALFNSTASIALSAFSRNRVASDGGRCAAAEPLKLSCAETALADFFEPLSGGALYSFGSRLSVSDSAFEANAAGDGGDGGGMFVSGGAADIARSAFNGNTATRGAGLFGRAAAVAVAGATFSGNAAAAAGVSAGAGAGSGAGAFFSGGEATLRDSTLVSNAASASGAALAAAAGAQVALSRCALRLNAARSGAAVSVNGASGVDVADSAVAANAASRSGGAAEVADSSSLAALRTNFTENTAGEVGAAFVLSPNATLRASSCNVSANYADVGGAACFVFSPGAAPGALTDPSNTVSANAAGRWGNIVATDGFAAVASLPPQHVAGSPLALSVNVLDGLGQRIAGLPRATVSVTCPEDPSATGGDRAVTTAFDSEDAPVTGVTFGGVPGRSYTLRVAVNAPLFEQDLVASAVVSVAPCAQLQAYDPASRSCLCSGGSQLTANGCTCPDAFHAVTNASTGVVTCRPCPATGAICVDGFLLPEDGFWHARCGGFCDTASTRTGDFSVRCEARAGRQLLLEALPTPRSPLPPRPAAPRAATCRHASSATRAPRRSGASARGASSLSRRRLCRPT